MSGDSKTNPFMTSGKGRGTPSLKTSTPPLAHPSAFHPRSSGGSRREIKFTSKDPTDKAFPAISSLSTYTFILPPGVPDPLDAARKQRWPRTVVPLVEESCSGGYTSPAGSDVDDHEDVDQLEEESELTDAEDKEPADYKREDQKKKRPITKGKFKGEKCHCNRLITLMEKLSEDMKVVKDALVRLEGKFATPPPITSVPMAYSSSLEQVWRPQKPSSQSLRRD